MRRVLSAMVLLAATAYSAGCASGIGAIAVATPTDPASLDLCVYSDKPGFITKHLAFVMMDLGTASTAQAPAAFRSVKYARSLEESADCDVAMKVTGGNVNRNLDDLLPVELYAVRTKKRLADFLGHAGRGRNSTYDIAIEKLRVGGEVYEQALSEAGSERQARAASKKAPTPIASAGVSKEDLRQMLSEAVKAAAPVQPTAAAAPVSSDVDAPRYKLAERADDYAVVVGVEKYAGLPDAAYAERDAKSVYEHLVALGYPARNIAMLTGAQATKTGLIKNLEAWLPQNVSEKSSVFFYYSGHGAPDPAAGAAYLVPSDGDPQYLDETSYPVKRLYEKLQALKAKRVLVAMDSCFSGSGGRSVLAKGTRPLVGKIELGAVTGKVASLTASASNQISGVIEAQGHGAFTYYLLRGLNGEAKDAAGSVTLKSLYGYLTPRVQDAAKRANRDQTPQLLLTSSQEDPVLR